MREAANMKKKMPVQMFLPPYFKDEHNMCPALSDEAKDKLNATDYDPLAREEKKCLIFLLVHYFFYCRECNRSYSSKELYP